MQIWFHEVQWKSAMNHKYDDGFRDGALLKHTVWNVHRNGENDSD